MGLLSSNQQLPSVRALAKALQINPMTISKAFAQLELEGVLIRKRGIGMLVAEQAKSKPLSKKIEQTLKKFINNAQSENFTDEEIFALVQQYISLKPIKPIKHIKYKENNND